MLVKGKNVLVIGASGDIGAAITKRLAQEGYHLILHYYSNRAAIDALWNDETEQQILQLIQADLSNQEGIEQLLASLVFNVDSIIFASGRAAYGLFQEMDEGTINEMLYLHVKAPLLITKQILPELIRKNSGHIIFITSIWGEIGASNEVLYSTVKGAQNSFVKALAKEIGLTDICVNAISPGFIDTKMNALLSIEEKNAIYEKIPLKRAGTPHEIAETVIFSLDAASSYMNGQIIQISGGWMI